MAQDTVNELPPLPKATDRRLPSLSKLSQRVEELEKSQKKIDGLDLRSMERHVWAAQQQGERLQRRQHEHAVHLEHVAGTVTYLKQALKDVQDRLERVERLSRFLAPQELPNDSHVERLAHYIGKYLSDRTDEQVEELLRHHGWDRPRILAALVKARNV